MAMHVRKCGSRRAIACLLGIAVFVMAGFAQADPPWRVARAGYLSGPVTFSPGGEEDWVALTLNRPLVAGDRVWADNGARVELQIGSAAVRLGETTSITLLNLDDRLAQFELAQGMMDIRVRRLDPGEVFEIDTPNLAFVISRPGQYRVSVDVQGDSTRVHTRAGQAVVYGQGASYAVAAGRAYRFAGTDLGDFEDMAPAGMDELDRWARDRDRSYDNSVSARYVSRDVIGYQDLDAYGTWRTVPEYGNVWMPSRVSSDWAPYRDGRWAWVEPWGWTWVDDAPWGFAVSHYGRWAHIGGGWGWIPGPVRARAVYAPALVAFIGGGDFRLSISSGNVGAVGWFPLGPRDVYRPPYAVSRGYFTNVNVSNTVINNTNITNVYNNRDVSRVTFANQQVAGAVVTVPTTVFVQSQPVARAALRLPHDAVVRETVSAVANVAPTHVSVHGAAPQGSKPPPQALERRVVARSKPPPEPVGFAARQPALAAQPGKPVDPAALSALRPDKPVRAQRVEVVAPARDARVVAPPSRAARPNEDGMNEQRANPQSTAPVAKPQPAPPEARGKPQPVPPEASGKPQPAQPEARGKPQPVQSVPVASPPSVQPSDRQPRASEPRPAGEKPAKADKPAKDSDPGKDEERGKGDEDGKERKKK
jgi:hypothetical protein